MAEYEWASPGGAYVVPEDFKQAFLTEFPEYRIRWSLKKGCWIIEQKCGRGALPPLRIDDADDSLVRARDGYWLVMEFQPGDRMPCPAVVDVFPRQICGWPMKVAHKKSAESTCTNCRQHNRDGRFIAAYWPFDESLLEHLRYTDPLRGGIQRQIKATEAQNKALQEAGDKAQRAAMSSLDYVDYRWLFDIPTAGNTRRRVTEDTFR